MSEERGEGGGGEKGREEKNRSQTVFRTKFRGAFVREKGGQTAEQSKARF